MPAPDDLLESFRTFFDLAPGSVDRQTPLGDLPIDSLSIVDWLLEVEERFGLELQAASFDTELTPESTVGDVLAVLLPEAPARQS